MVAAGEAMAAAGVDRVYLVHGTFGGSDALGLLTEMARIAPSFSGMLGHYSKWLIDCCVGDAGNYTESCARLLQECFSAGAGREIPVTRFIWSSQNNHISRADAAVRLLVELAERTSETPPATTERPRLLFWAHSHGGNVLALLGGLLAAEEEERTAFFEAARRFYCRWRTGAVDVGVWEQAASLLDEPELPLREYRLDVATFGTPIRYGWAEGNIERIVHFVNHRARPDGPDWRGPPRIRIGRVLRAADGDYVAQCGVAGSNLVPNPLAVRTFLADRTLARLLEEDLEPESILRRIARGCRVHDAGTTLLVNYDDPARVVTQHFAGHAVYTRTRWLPFHCRHVADVLYGQAP